MFVKICGITRLQDAEAAAGLGANAIGFVFWRKSPRYIEPAAAKAIVEKAPADVAKVGVFVDADVEAIARIADEVGLDIVQLHGRETPAFCRALVARLNGGSTEQDPPYVPGGSTEQDPAYVRRPGLALQTRHRTVIKAIGLQENGRVDIGEFDPDVVLLVDAHDPYQRGGTGRTANWDAAREIAASRRTILAGGLNAANVKLAIRSVRPYGVDVSSGVESAPGIKDPARLRSFFEALHD